MVQLKLIVLPSIFRIQRNLPLHSRKIWTPRISLPPWEGCLGEGFSWAMAPQWGACFQPSKPGLVLPFGLSPGWRRRGWYWQAYKKAGTSSGSLRAKAQWQQIPCWKQVHPCWPCSPAKLSLHHSIWQVCLPVWHKEKCEQVVGGDFYSEVLAASTERYEESRGAKQTRGTGEAAAAERAS